jgi:DNA replication protein DnaC
VRSWAESGGKPAWLALLGSLGSGKTSLAVCAYKEARMRHGDRAVWWNVAALLEAIKSTFDKDAATDWNPLHIVRETAAFAVLDDLGAERPTEWAQDVIRQILHSRYDRMLPTIVTTNLSLSELEQWVGARAMDRIRHDSLVVALNGASLRAPGAA